MKNLVGCSVTKRIKQVKQPYGGYIRPSSLEVIEMENVTELLKPPFDKPIAFVKLFDAPTRTAIVQTINQVRDNAVHIVA